MTKKLTPADGEFMGFGTWLKSPRGIFCCCPNCGTPFALDRHEIDDMGLVSPIVTCPNTFCTFVDEIQLQDWTMETPSE